MVKEYTVYFQGKMVVEAESEAEATGEAYDTLNELEQIEFNITTTEEGECVECGGDGEVAEDVDDGEGHTMRGVGRKPCPACKHNNQ